MNDVQLYPVRPTASAGRLLLGACLGFIIAAILMVLFINALHRLSYNQRQAETERARNIEIVREERERPEVQKPIPPDPVQQQDAPRAPLPQLDSLLAGVDLGIPEFQVNDIAGSAESLLGEAERGDVMSESSVDTQPRVIYRSPLVYPRNALRRGISGSVLINLLINEEGDVDAAKVLSSEPTGIFDSAALRGVQGWRFSPARYKGQPVKIWARQRIRFDADS